MRITRLKWLPDIIEKLIVKHAVEPYEVEEVFFSAPSGEAVVISARDMTTAERRIYARK
jgi:uncharacterized DUF497 family protein